METLRGRALGCWRRRSEARPDRRELCLGSRQNSGTTSARRKHSQTENVLGWRRRSRPNSPTGTIVEHRCRQSVGGNGVQQLTNESRYRHLPDCRVTPQPDDNFVLDLDEVEFPTGSNFGRYEAAAHDGADSDLAASEQGQVRSTGRSKLVPGPRLKARQDGPGSQESPRVEVCDARIQSRRVIVPLVKSRSNKRRLVDPYNPPPRTATV